MSTPIFSPSRRPFVAGLVAMIILAGGLQAQYVSTLISNGLSEPYGVAADPNDNLYIADALNNRVALYVPGTKTLSTLATGFSQPQGIVYARGGLAVVDQGNQVIRFVTLGGVVTTLAGSLGNPGLNNATGTSAQFSYPTGIAVGNDGLTLYVADQGNNAVRMVSSNNAVTTLATTYTYNSATERFKSPASVAVDNNNNIWIADTGNHVICVITNGTTGAYGIAGTYRTSGTNDGAALTAKFNQPGGLLWDNANQILVISDTQNDTVRSLTNSGSGFAVQTLAGIAGVRGLVDGTLSAAEFNQPFGLCVDAIDSGYYVADWGNNAVRVLEPTQPPPAPVQIGAPVIGYVVYEASGTGTVAQFIPFTQPVSVFNNPVNLAIEQLDGTVETFLSYGATGTTIPPPGTNTIHVSAFTQINVGQPPPVPLLNIGLLPAMTLETISTAPGRPSSQAVSAQVDFVTANPAITGQNSEAIYLTDVTSNAEIYYTTNGQAPVIGSSYTFGPVNSSQTISFAIITNTTLTAQAFATDFAPSGVVSAVFSPANSLADEMTFGFESGQASSEFITAPGQTFIAPVTMTLIPTANVMYTLQFNLAVSNLLTAPPIPTTGSHAYTFSSMLMQQFPGPVYYPIPPAMVAGGLLLSNYNTTDLLEVGWLERPPFTNLYNTKQQTLIEYSLAKDTLYGTGSSFPNQVIVGGFSFYVPTTATVGQQYEIQVASPSATSDGIATPVFIETLTNGSMTNGPINSIKLVTVGQAHYLVGDVAPFYWFNAGDFGDNYLENNDVTETFQTAIYGYNGTNASTQHSDYFDAMDSSDGTDNNYYLGTDTAINNIQYGDGVLAVDDVYVTFRRSLDPSLVWYDRYDTAAGKAAVAVPNLLPQPFSSAAPAAATVAPSGPRYISVAADQVQSGGNLSVQVPIRILAADTLPVTVAMLHVEVDALDGSPPITNNIDFFASTNLGTMFDSASLDANDYAGAWLNSGSPGVSGTNIFGTLYVTLPANVTTNSSYLVHFDHFSASPNGLALFHATVQDGLITVGNRTASSWHDGISDAWRLLWFGTVSNALSAATADPDGDGANNWQEYVAGTNPNDPASAFKFLPGGTMGPSSFTLQWSSVVNKHYSVQTSYKLAPAYWTTLATNIVGTGQPMQWTDSNATGKSQYYRAIVQ